jgi:hypothetical protein
MTEVGDGPNSTDRDVGALRVTDDVDQQVHPPLLEDHIAGLDANSWQVAIAPNGLADDAGFVLSEQVHEQVDGATFDDGLAVLLRCTSHNIGEYPSRLELELWVLILVE